MDFFSIIALIGGGVALFASIAIRGFPIMMFGAFLMFTGVLLHYYSLDQQKGYVEIKRIDSNKYIQCMESQQYIVSSSSSRGADAIAPLLDANGKPMKCNNTIYTKAQIALPMNKNKKFIIK